MPTFAQIPARNFAHLLWDAGAAYADRLAMIERGQPSVTFASLRKRAEGIASALAAQGVGPGDRVGVSLKRGEDAAAAFFAVLAVGATAINVNEMYRPRQVEYVLAHAKARALVTSADVLAAHPRALDTKAEILDVATLGGGTFTPVERDGHDEAQICYTSGSTGQPKGVRVSHRNLWAGVTTVVGYLGMRADDRIASLLPFSFVYGFNQLACSLATGATLAIERSALPLEIVNALRGHEVTVLAAVPPLWLQLLKTPGFGDKPLPSLRIATNAGGRIPPEAVLRLLASQPQVHFFSMYGLTEVFRSTYLPPELAAAHPDSMGSAVPGAEVYVVREDGTLAETGEVESSCIVAQR